MSAMAQQQRALELTLLSAKDLKDVNLLSKMKVYALVSLLIGDPARSSCQRVAPDRSGGRNPTWNATLRFTVPANAAGSMHVLLRAERALGDRDVGEVHIPLSELLSWAPGGVMPLKFVAYQVSKIGSGRPQGVLNLSYKLGEVVTHGGGQAAYPPAGKVDAYAPTQSAYPPPQSAYAPLTAPGAPPPQYSYGYPAQQQLAGYGYPPPPPQGGYGYGYPQQQQQPAGYGYPPPPSQGGYGHGYPQQQQPAGYGCPPQPPEGGYGYGYHYQQQAVKPPKKSGMGMGLGAGLLGGALGGLLIGDMISDSSGGAGF